MLQRLHQVQVVSQTINFFSEIDCMSGSCQHYLPQFLMRGFVFERITKKKSKDRFYTWYCTKNSIPAKKDIKKIGWEYQFNDISSTSTVDNIITDQESELALEVNRLRTIKKTIELKRSFPAILVSHIRSRSKNIRQCLHKLSEEPERLIRDILSNKNDFCDFLETLINTMPEKIEPLKREIDTVKAQSIPDAEKQKRIELLKEISIKHLRQDNGFDDSRINAIKAIDAMKKNSLAEKVKKSHLQAIKQENIQPKAHVEKFEKLNWTLVVNQPFSYILGDIGAISQHTDSLTFDSISTELKNLKIISLPISDQHLLVGKTDDTLPFPNPKQLNIATASFSYNFFISKRNEVREVKFSEYISTRFPPISEKERTAMKKDIIQGKFLR